jgi:hypothetical protein
MFASCIDVRPFFGAGLETDLALHIHLFNTGGKTLHDLLADVKGQGIAAA